MAAVSDKSLGTTSLPIGFVPARRQHKSMPKGPVSKKDTSPAVAQATTNSAGEPAEGPARGSTSEWGGIAMLAHCAQTVEEETAPAVQAPATKARASEEGIKKGAGAGGEAEDSNYSRKEKSLGLLCDKFLQEYSSAAEVCLDAAARRLGVERRRIYDIVNVLESVEVVQRKAKNRYIWYGVTRLPQALHRQYMLGPPENDKSDDDESDGSEHEGDRADAPKGSTTVGKRTSRREKSLGVLSQKFVRLFLHASCGVVSLEAAARRLMDDASIDENRLKTKIRRLYDIANILCSLNLIEKTHLADGSRKPAFKWKYPCKHLGLEAISDGAAPVGIKPEGSTVSRAEGKRSSSEGGAGPSKKSKKDSKKRSSSAGLPSSALNSMLPASIPSMGSPLVGGAMHPALMMGLLNSMNASSVAAPSGKDSAGGGVAGGGSPAVGLAGMLDSPKDMQAYMQAYFAQMAGMQSMLSQLAGTVKPPDSDAGKEEPKAEASKDAAKLAAGESATKDAPAALAGAPPPGADVVMPTYLQMMCAWMSQFQAASAGAAPKGLEPNPPPPPPPVSAPEGPRTSAGGESGAAPALGVGIDLNASMPFMPSMDLQTLQNAAAMWQMMSTGGISLDGASRSIGGAVLPGPEGGVPSAPPVAAASAAAPAIPAAPTAGTAAGCGTTPEAVTAEGAAGSVEEAGAAPVEAVSVQAAAEGALVAGNDSLDSGASTKPDVDLKPPGGDEMLEE